MPFQLRPYFPPVFSTPALENAPDAVFRPAPRDGVAPENFHAMSIFPEYFKIAGQWHLARESRMDCVAVLEEGHAHAAAAGSFFVYYGRNRAILITAPSEEEYRHSGIYVDDQDN